MPILEVIDEVNIAQIAPKCKSADQIASQNAATKITALCFGSAQTVHWCFQ